MASLLFRPRTAYRNAARFRQIANILARQGFGFILDQSGMQPWPLRIFRRAEEPAFTAPERLRIAIEEIGPTAVKLGQVLSTRADFVPPAMLQELTKLQDTVPPFPFPEVLETIERELGMPAKEVFANLEPVPVAAASLSQVHRAWLADGEEVAIKVQRPSIQQQIETDIDITLRIARILERRTIWGRAYNLSETAEEFARTIREELDFTNEGRNIDQFATTFRGHPGVKFPTVFWEYTTRRVLTMSWVEGFKITDLGALEAAGIDRNALAHRFASLILEMVLIHGAFHADPHPGNVLVTPAGDIAFLDFGMVGYLDETLKDELVQLVLALVRRDVAGITNELLDIGVIHEAIDFRRFRNDLARLLRRYYNVPLKQLPISQVVNDTLQVAYRYHLQLPADLALLGRAMSTMEGVALTLDPEISIVSVAEPFGRRLVTSRYGLNRGFTQIRSSALEVAELLRKLPVHVDRLLSVVESGDLRVNVAPVVPDRESDVMILANRIVLALIIVAGIISSVLMLSITDRTLVNYAGGATLVLTGFLTIWLTILSVRSR
jgi:ubiquinone biosynthesis protein